VADPNSPSQQLVGAVLNQRWKLVRLLGEGGMGAVFEATSLRGEGTRAIKLLHPEFCKEEQILQRFFAEAQTSQALQHPNIARTYESARAEDGTPYLVMELLQGQPLAAWIDAGTPMQPQQAAPVIHAVLQALQVAHQSRVIHRDLKPDNIFMTRDASGQYVAKVLDFGIAKVMDAAGGMGSKTRTGVLLGTPGYMSPEQIKNSKAVDVRSDLWAVGIIFYEMLTCRLPFDAENEFARLTAVLTDTAKPIESVMPQLASWSGFFRRALASEPNDRFQTAEEMANALMLVARGGSMPSVATGSATVAMAAMPEWNAPAAPAPAPQGRFGASTVPSSPSPATFQGVQQAAPQTYQGAQQQAGPQTYQGAQQAAPQTYQGAQTALAPPGASPQGPGTMPGAQQAHYVITPPPAPARQPGNTYQSAQPVALPVPGPAVGDGRQNPTHVSAQRPPGMAMPSTPPPNVQIVDAPPLPRGLVPTWIAIALGGACLLVGFVVGLIVGR
jgi:serine/threonine protein kinase